MRYDRQSQVFPAYVTVNIMELPGQGNGISQLPHGQALRCFQVNSEMHQVGSLVFYMIFQFANYFIFFRWLQTDMTG